MTITLLPARLRAIQTFDMRDAYEAIGDAFPPDPDQITSQVIKTLEERAWVFQAHISQLKQTVQQVENCEARRRMHGLNDMSDQPDVVMGCW